MLGGLEGLAAVQRHGIQLRGASTSGAKKDHHGAVGRDHRRRITGAPCQLHSRRLPAQLAQHAAVHIGVDIGRGQRRENRSGADDRRAAISAEQCQVAGHHSVSLVSIRAGMPRSGLGDARAPLPGTDQHAGRHGDRQDGAHHGE